MNPNFANEREFNFSRNTNSPRSFTRTKKRKSTNDELNKFQSPQKIVIPNVYKSISPSAKSSPSLIPMASEDEELPAEAFLSDTAIALQVLRSHEIEMFQDYLFDAQIGTPSKKASYLIVNTESLDKYKHSIPPVILRSQVYSIVQKATEADREMETMKLEKKIRIFKLLTDKDDYAIVNYEDYVKQIFLEKERMTIRNKENTVTNLSVFDDFVEKLLPYHHDVSINKENLKKFLAPEAKEMNEADITLLVNAGILIMRDVDTFWFSIPNAGTFLKNVSQGRKEILSIISRQKWKEILKEDLERKKLRYSALGMAFHLKDILGKGLAESVTTTAGSLIRLRGEKDF